MRVMLKCLKHCGLPQDISAFLEISHINKRKKIKKMLDLIISNADTQNLTCLLK